MENHIDFDDASIAWRANKKTLTGGWFAYVCEYIHSNGKRCNRAVEFSKKPQMYRIREDWVCRSISRNPDHYCWQHRNRHTNFIITDGIGSEIDP
jgi:hypothetical protein